MNQTVSNVIMFVVGATIGSVTTYFVMKPKYDKLIEEEQASLSEVYKRYEKRNKEVKPVSEVLDTEDYIETVSQDGKPELNDLVRGAGYKTDYTGFYPKKETKKRKKVVKKVETQDDPYVVPPEEFGEKQDDAGEDYDKITLHFYSDKVLTDDLHDPVEDVETTVGYDSLNHFGEYEDSTVFVRNDRLKTDFEILLELEKYSDVKARGPRGSEA